MLKIFKRFYRKIKNFFINLKRSTKWFIRMWNNYDWDYNFLIMVMVYKMKDMRHQFDYVDKDFVDLRNQPINGMGENLEDCETEDQLKGLDRAIYLGEKIINSEQSYDFPEDVKQYLYGVGKTDVEWQSEMREKFLEICKKQDDEYNNNVNEFFNVIKKEHGRWWS